MQCAPTYQLTLAWVQEPDLLWRPSMVSRRTMCPKEVVERWSLHSTSPGLHAESNK
jgi:hypothetical protein